VVRGRTERVEPRAPLGSGTPSEAQTQPAAGAHCHGDAEVALHAREEARDGGPVGRRRGAAMTADEDGKDDVIRLHKPLCALARPDVRNGVRSGVAAGLVTRYDYPAGWLRGGGC
jgi:hypothetical protein